MAEADFFGFSNQIEQVIAYGWFSNLILDSVEKKEKEKKYFGKKRMTIVKYRLKKAKGLLKK